MNFNQLLQKGEELAQSQGLGGNSNSGSGSGSGSGNNLQQYESYAKDAQTAYTDFNQEGTFSDRAQKTYSDIQNNHKSSSNQQSNQEGSNQQSNESNQ